MSATNEAAAIVPHIDGTHASTSTSSAVVLDALPYVEPLDPNYENYALSLIEDELHKVVADHQQRGGRGNDCSDPRRPGEHPSLERILPASRCISGGTDLTTQTLDFGGKAPLATAAFAALAARRAESGNGDDAAAAPYFLMPRPDPMEEDEAEDTDEDTLMSNLRTSITTAKIRLEQERLRLINLELHQALDTPARYAAYASRLEAQYLTPASEAVERQQRTVDGVNATRMEEQRRSIEKLDGMAQKWEFLVDKNRRLGKALAVMEGEVECLKGQVAEGGGEKEALEESQGSDD